MKRPFIYPHTGVSSGARLLSQALDCRRIRRTVTGVSRYVPRKDHLVVNWGNGDLTPWMQQLSEDQIVNMPRSVTIAQNKLLTFEQFKIADITHPEWTTDFRVAQEWALKKRVVARSLLRASGGKGITIYGPQEPLVEPHRDILWVKYIPKKKEYRVHVFKGEVIRVQQKLRRREFDGERDTQIRNLENGYIYASEHVGLEPEATTLAVGACAALKLDFGAVDIIWNEKLNKYFLLEVNTAPGVQGHTVDAYVESIRKLL